MSTTKLRKRVIYGSAFASVFITVLTLGLDLIFGKYKDKDKVFDYLTSQ